MPFDRAAWDRNRIPYKVKYNKGRRLRNKQKLVELFGGLCMDCKQAWPPFVMEFDHRDPALKAFNLGGTSMQFSWDRLVEEAKKCDLVCSNCHRVRTHKQRCEGCEICV